MLRGEEFNSVNENGDRIIRALAAGMGVARKDLKAMADNGLLTIDKVVPAITAQLRVMQEKTPILLFSFLSLSIKKLYDKIVLLEFHPINWVQEYTVPYLS